MSVPRPRLLELMKAQCQIFSTTYNPDRLRLGTKVLRQRIKGPALAAYYPRKTATVQHIIKGFGPDWTSWDEKEVDRLEKIEQLKLRGKGAPNKKKGPTLTKDKKKK